MSSVELVKNVFNESIQTKIDSADALPELVARASELITRALVSNNKILLCGTGIEATLAQAFTTLLLHQVQKERPGLPAICLSDNVSLITAINDDNNLNEVFSKQVRALGNAGDILISITKDGNCFPCVQAIRAALSKDMLIVALSGDDGGQIAGLTGADDVEILIPSTNTLRVNEVQLMIINCIATVVDSNLFGEH
ncbi:MAG TPA: SIS domain-containing protein [Aeromonadales bacterium]|nr:SIS domain-containing protein [Aeromonadales bacterium]